jgi:hypothetical protein
MVEKAAKLDRDTFGVAVGQGPWQRRLEGVANAGPPPWWAEICPAGVGRGRVAPCSGHGDGGQLEVTRASGSGDGRGLGGDSSWGAGYGGDVGRVDRQ